MFIIMNLHSYCFRIKLKCNEFEIFKDRKDKIHIYVIISNEMFRGIYQNAGVNVLRK